MSALSAGISFFMNARLQEAFALEKAAWDQSQRLHEFLTLGGAERMRQFHLALLSFATSCKRMRDLGRMPATMRRLESTAYLVSDLITEGGGAKEKIGQIEAALKTDTGGSDDYERSVSVFRTWARRCEFYASRVVKKTH